MYKIILKTLSNKYAKELLVIIWLEIGNGDYTGDKILQI